MTSFDPCASNSMLATRFSNDVRFSGHSSCSHWDCRASFLSSLSRQFRLLSRINFSPPCRRIKSPATSRFYRESAASVSVSKQSNSGMEKSATASVLTSVVIAVVFGCLSLGGDCCGIPLHKESKAQSTVFPVSGNVYPLGYYSVTMKIGNPPKAYELDIDSGSDLTWIECDAPCTGCNKPRNQLYKPKNNVVRCGDPLCSSIQAHCNNPKEQCDYSIDYADQGSSLGVLVNDTFHLKLANESIITPRLTFGCGYDQQYNGYAPPSATVGVLGVGSGKASINSQLQSLGIIDNVVGHCFSSKGGGYLFLGSGHVPSKINWIPSRTHSSEKAYAAGPAELLFDGHKTEVKKLYLTFDSGSSYSYFNSQVYKTVISLITSNVETKSLKRASDNTLPICWKGRRPFRSIDEAKGYFKPMALSFTKGGNAQFVLNPEDYLILSKSGRFCLGILNGTEIGLGNANIVGDIFMQDKMVVYDTESGSIGWVSGACGNIPKF